MTFNEKHSILDNQLVGDEDEVQVSYLEVLKPELKRMVQSIKRMNKERNEHNNYKNVYDYH